MPIPSEQIRAVVASYSRVRGASLAEAFYDRFLRADEEARARFAHTDFDRQRDLFLHGLFALIDYARDGAMGRLAVRRLAKTHGGAGLNIPERLYDVWIDTLIETLAEVDQEWSEELSSAWSAVLCPGITVIRAA